MSLKIIKAGILDTIQDSGRYGYQHLGINPTGTMDSFSAQLANALLGKKLDTLVIEIHFPASVFLFEKTAVACISGADFSATLNDQPIPLHQPFIAPENSRLQFKRWISGTRCYLSLLHDLQVEEWLQSASTNLKAFAGGWKGRKLLKDDCILYKEKSNLVIRTNSVDPTTLHWKASSLLINNKMDCIKGNEWNWLTAQAQELFQNTNFTISRFSDRMGYRLDSKPLIAVQHKDLVSSAVNFGTVQLLPNGQLIILMADHQTTGGYPRLAHVSSTSLSSLAQLNPKDEIRFQFISLLEAEDNLLQQQRYLEQLRNTCKLKIENLLHAAM